MRGRHWRWAGRGILLSCSYFRLPLILPLIKYQGVLYHLPQIAL
jgi:hypothetical protein